MPVTSKIRYNFKISLTGTTDHKKMAFFFLTKNIAEPKISYLYAVNQQPFLLLKGLKTRKVPILYPRIVKRVRFVKKTDRLNFGGSSIESGRPSSIKRHATVK